MKLTLTTILIAAGLLLAIVFLLVFGFSDLWLNAPWNHEEIEAKPWRPIARLAFSFAMIGLLIGTTGVVLKVVYR